MRILDSMIGWLAPPVCIGCGLEGSSLCPGCRGSEIIPFGAKCWNCGSIARGARRCERCRRAGSPARVWINTDYEGTAKQLVRLYKYGHQRAAAIPLAEMMAETFKSTSSAKELQSKNFLLVPVPTASSRIRSRSFDHSALLASRLGPILGLEVRGVLGRLGQSRQVGARRELRLKQLSGKFYVKAPMTVKGRNIILVDDVLTTGATVTVAAEVLRQAGAKSVSALVFAKKL